MVSPDNVFMIGWEYPPQNSGGLGVACQGLTQSLADQNTNIYFTLPYHQSQLNVQIPHMEVLACAHPTWQTSSDHHSLRLKNPPHAVPPFQAYETSIDSDTRVGVQQQYYRPVPADAQELAALPQSELEHRVAEYASVVKQSAQKPDFGVIHAHDWMSFPAAQEVKAQTGKPFIAHVHSTEFDRIPHGGGSHFIKQTEYEGLQAADTVIAVSHYTKRLLTRAYGVNPEKIEVVHNGMLPSLLPLDPGRHHFAHHRPVVVFMGRITSQKGPHHFLWLAERLVAKIPDLLCVIAGNGDMYHELLLRTAEKGLSASVLFSGFVRDKQREKLLDRADIFVMPSLSEPFGLVALEAAERHTPVIISKTSGVKEVLPSAVAVDFWDIQQMTDAVQKLLADKHHHQQVSTNQLKELSSVTWDSAAEKVRQVYRKTFLGRL